MPENMVGMDLGSPPQNSVPNPRYRQDPFQKATVEESGRSPDEVQGLGFRRKNPYEFDPFEDQELGAAPRFTTDQDFQDTGEYDQYYHCLLYTSPSPRD